MSGRPLLQRGQDDVVYVLMELRQEIDYVLHHAQKIIASFAVMRDLAVQLQQAGHRIYYIGERPHNGAFSVPS